MIAGGSPAGDEPLSKEEIARLGKAATGLVEIRNGLQVVYGSAFCVHPSGLFLTNDHLLRSAFGLGVNRNAGAAVDEVTLVLNPSQKGEKVCKAKVVRSDKELDLALLRIEGVKDLPIVTLGSDAKLSELAEVVAVGFPFGTALSTKRKDYPAVSINKGSITALRRRDDRLQLIQLDVQLNPGNSGGPVLDATGKVVGIVVAGIEGRGVNFAIPVSIVSRFVAKPDVEFDPPILRPANIHQAVLFEANVRPILPASTPITVDLILKPTGGKDRTFRMEPADGKFRVSAVPVPPVPDALPLRLVAQFDNGSLNGTMADRALKVGEQTIKFSEIHSIQLRPKSRAQLLNGKWLEGPISGLDAVAIRLGGQSLSVDLSKSMEVKVGPAVAADQVGYTLLVQQGGQEILRLAGSMVVQGALAAAGIDGPTDIRAPALAASKVVHKLAVPVANVVEGGGGRYLVLHLAKANKLAVFDVSAAKVVGDIPFGEPDAMFAAGQEHVFVVLPHSGKIERWSFRGLEREATAELPIEGIIKSVTMGAASKGPLLVHFADGTEQLSPAAFALVDGSTLKALRTSIKPNFMLGAFYRDFIHVRAAANGKVFGMWGSNRSPNGLGILTMTDSDERMSYDHLSTGYVVPSPDGKIIFTMAGQRAPEMADPRLMMMPKADDPMLPACYGDSYIHLPPGSKAGTVVIRSVGRKSPIATLTDVELPEFGSRPIGVPMQATNTAPTDFTPDKRVHLVPSARLLIVIPTSNDRLVLHQYGE
jgi:hypothetical protein